MPILVTYATAKGSTREIAQRIASCLEVFTNPIECKPIEEVEISSLGNYSAIIIGSAVHMQSWLKKAHEFIHDNAATLNSKPVWAFSVGLPKGEADRLREEEVINKKIKKDLVCLQRHQLFRGRWDMKDFWYLKFFLCCCLSEKDSYEDRRDWEAIETWARSVGEELGESRRGLATEVSAV